MIISQFVCSIDILCKEVEVLPVDSGHGTFCVSLKNVAQNDFIMRGESKKLTEPKVFMEKKCYLCRLNNC